MSDSPLHVQLAVIGAGPCGIAVGIAARLHDIQCVLFDRGCVVSSISRYPVWMTFFSTADRLELADVPFIVAGEKPTRREALRYYQGLVTHFDLDVRQYEEVVAVERIEVGGSDARFSVRSRTLAGSDTELTADAVVVATGYFDSPNPLGVPGEDLPHVAHNYREGHTFFGQRVLVIGGGNSAVDAALELHRWGAHVTLAHFQPALDPNIKPWVRPDIEARLRDGDIRAEFGVRVTEIRSDSVLLQRVGPATADGEGEPQAAGKVPPPLQEDAAAGQPSFEVPVDFVLAMTGYTPDGRLLRSLGVEFDPVTGVPHHDPATMETNIPGVFIAGVLSAGYDANKVFIENGRGHGARIVARLSPGH